MNAAAEGRKRLTFFVYASQYPNPTTALPSRKRTNKVNMKKLYILFALVLAGLCASAQEKGDMAIGVNLGAAPCLESGMSVTNFGLGAKFQYNVTNPVRLEADLDYWFESNGFDVFDVSANVQYIFKAGKLNVYPTIGLGLASVGQLNLLFNVGLGAEYPVNDKLSIGAELKYQYIDNFSRLPITIGATYKF